MAEAFALALLLIKLEII